MATYAIILGGGSGSRMQSKGNKVLLPLLGMPVLFRAMLPFISLCEGIILVLRKEDKEIVSELLEQYSLSSYVTCIVIGGETRQNSVYNGLLALPSNATEVLVHDGARALIDTDCIKRVISSTKEKGSGIASVNMIDTVKTADSNGKVLATLNREELFAMQTPQGFLVKDLKNAHAKAKELSFTDDAGVMEYNQYPVYLVEGNRNNIKLTTPIDMLIAKEILLARKTGTKGEPMRIGHGFDVHALVEGRKCILCGVDVPHTKGLLGHSDADVGTHALMDAILGALCLGDIGKHFPDNDNAFKDIDSLLLLKKVVELMEKEGYRIGNVDVTLVAQKPKLAPYILSMRETLAKILKAPLSSVNVKATTTEWLGFEGEEKGITAHAVCLLVQ